MTPFKVNMVCHLWDLVDAGIDEALDRLGGELGVTGVCVPVVCPPAARLRSRPAVSPRIFRSAGGLCFVPQDRHYAATRCKPVVAGWLKRSRDAFGRVVDACAKRELEVRAVVFTSTAGQLAARYPHAAAKTAFGDAWPDRVCLVNPDVQAFVMGVCADLTSNRGVTTVELADLHAGRLGTVLGGLDAGVELGPGGEALLGLCFCESCRQLGASDAGSDGLDSSAAVRSVEVRLGRILETGEPLSAGPAEVFGDDPVLAAHLRAQWRAIGGLVKAVRAECQAELAVHLYDDVISQSCEFRVASSELNGGRCPTRNSQLATEEVLPHVDALVSVTRRHLDDALERTARSALERAGGRIRTEMQIQAFRCDGPAAAADPPGLVRTLSRLAELGVASVNLEEYGTIPEAGLTGVKQAVRFARRTPTGEAG